MKWGCSSDSLRYHRKHSATGVLLHLSHHRGGISVGSLSTWLGTRCMYERKLSLFETPFWTLDCWDFTGTHSLVFRSRAAKRGCFKRGGFPIWTFPSFFVLFCPFWDFPDFSGIFPICSGMVRGFSRFALFLFLGLLRAPTRNSPERVCDTIWTFPEKSGKHPGLETPRFSFSQLDIWILEPEWSSSSLSGRNVLQFPD